MDITGPGMAKLNEICGAGRFDTAQLFYAAGQEIRKAALQDATHRDYFRRIAKDGTALLTRIVPAERRDEYLANIVPLSILVTAGQAINQQRLERELKAARRKISFRHPIRGLRNYRAQHDALSLAANDCWARLARIGGAKLVLRGDRFVQARV